MPLSTGFAPRHLRPASERHYKPSPTIAAPLDSPVERSPAM
jgi:hypothetical protein